MGLSIIFGNMFSGKTSELIRRLKRLKVIGKNILVINSAKDVRGGAGAELRTHDNVRFNCHKVQELHEMLGTTALEDADVVAIDEAQFFSNVKDFVEKCLDLKKEIIIAGLEADCFQKKWGEILDCIPLACEVTQLTALCNVCKDGTPGSFTKRIVNDTCLELVGGSDMYMAVCRKHLTVNV